MTSSNDRVPHYQSFLLLFFLAYQAGLKSVLTPVHLVLFRVFKVEPDDAENGRQIWTGQRPLSFRSGDGTGPRDGGNSAAARELSHVNDYRLALVAQLHWDSPAPCNPPNPAPLPGASPWPPSLAAALLFPQCCRGIFRPAPREKLGKGHPLTVGVFSA